MQSNELYIIKGNFECKCGFDYSRYLYESKFDLIEILKLSEQKNEDLKEYKKKCERLQEENELLKKQEELKYFKNSKFEDFYDIVIDINSIKSINNEGWKVKFNENGRKKYEDHKDQELIIIGVIGNNNKGKSFILSKISKIKLLTGTSIHTEGLSVKYPDLEGYKGRELILLDSAGLETPVLKSINNEKQKDKDTPKDEIIEQKEEQEIGYSKHKKKIMINKEIEQIKEFKENARDKITTELFLENFIIKVSDILLVVVGKLTYSEQLLINKLKVESRKENKSMIFIIHNLQDFRSVEQVKDYIQNTLLKCSTFNLNKKTWISSKKDEEKKAQENEINKENENDYLDEEKNDKKIVGEIVDDFSKLYDIHFTEVLYYGDSKKLDIFHLILANEYSEAGKVYNQYTYNFIENVYNLISKPKKFDIFEEVKDQFKSLSNVILNNNIENVPFTNNKQILENKIIKLELEEPLSLKKCYTDELGFSFFKTDHFQPKYNYFKVDENTLEIRLEIPGKTECSINHKVIGDETIIMVKGRKMKDRRPDREEDVIFNIREFGEFELNIPLKVQDFRINQNRPKEGYPKIINGIFCVQYELAPKGEEIKVIASDEEL